ncbi:MAG: flagellar biosynthesis protein FlhF [Rubrivivax sp.]|nr:flagellar biosynthesis protein FlhF [Rubrivivax sp.]
MNLKRFTARTSREALAMVKQAFGDDAVVMSTKPCAEGVEVLAMAPESIQQLERIGQTAEHMTPPTARERLPATAARGRERQEPRFEPAVEAPPETQSAQAPRAPRRAAEAPLAQDIADDVEQLQMSTLSFQDYVRQRMLKRRDTELQAERSAAAAAAPLPPSAAPIEAARARHATRREPAAREVPVLREEVPSPVHPAEPAVGMARAASAAAAVLAAQGAQIEMQAVAARGAERTEMMSELRSMRGLIEQRFGALAFMEKLQRHPRQAALAQRLLDTGFSPALIRKLVDGAPAEGDELAWAAHILERNLPTGEREAPLEETGGIYAMIGATGVGKTTSTAKLAAAFATRHGAANLGLITLDAYRVGAHEQLRTYGRILGVPVHTAHDRASLEDLLDLLSAKKMVLIDTAGMAQRDTRTRELLDMLSHRAINRLLVVNASAQGETIEDQLAAYAAPNCRGIVLSKLDEAVKLGPALDSMIRHKLKVLAVANGQRVPEDWHRLSANALVQRALKGGGTAAWRLDDSDVNLIFAGMPAVKAAMAAPVHA